MSSRVQGGRARGAGEPDPGPSDAVCSHFQRGMCRFGAGCAFRHTMLASELPSDVDEDSLEAYQHAYRTAEARLAALRAADASREDIATSAATLCELLPRIRRLTGAASSRLAVPRRQRRVKNDNRASIFRRFLLDTYGEQLASGAGVLDIAGGQGVLSFELLNYNRVEVTVIDPRPALRLAKLERHYAAVHRKPAAPEASVAMAIGGATVATASSSQPRRPRHWAVYWRDALWSPLVDKADASADEAGTGGVITTPSAAALATVGQALREAPPQAPSSRRQRKGPSPDEAIGDALEGASEPPAPPPLPSALELHSALRECSAVVGMHPDAATEPIVDFALAAGKPFAVVPCCVFAVDFPSRRGPEGAPVDTHGAFVRYLQAKAPERIRLATLPFEGKNIVVYSLPTIDAATGGEASCQRQSLRDEPQSHPQPHSQPSVTCLPCEGDATD